MKGTALVSMLWEARPYRRDQNEVFADISGIGRYSISRAAVKGQYKLTLGRAGGIEVLYWCANPAQLRECAAIDLERRMLGR